MILLIAIGFAAGSLVGSILTQMENNRARNKPRPLLDKERSWADIEAMDDRDHKEIMDGLDKLMQSHAAVAEQNDGVVQALANLWRAQRFLFEAKRAGKQR